MHHDLLIIYDGGDVFFIEYGVLHCCRRGATAQEKKSYFMFMSQGLSCHCVFFSFLCPPFFFRIGAGHLLYMFIDLSRGK